MYTYPALIAGVILVCLFGGIWLGLSFFAATIVFFVVAVGLSPIAVHKIERYNFAFFALCALALFASYPMKNLLGMDDFVLELGVSVIYLGMLWVTGFGWRRKWS